MWTNVGKRPRRPTRSELETDSEGGEDEDEQRAQRMSVDCTSSSRGLFLGILLMVGTIISIIAFYMLVNQEEMGVRVIERWHRVLEGVGGGGVRVKERWHGVLERGGGG